VLEARPESDAQAIRPERDFILQEGTVTAYTRVLRRKGKRKAPGQPVLFIAIADAPDKILAAANGDVILKFDIGDVAMFADGVLIAIGNIKMDLQRDVRMRRIGMVLPPQNVATGGLEVDVEFTVDWRLKRND
jgi:hypothetical protein